MNQASHSPKVACAKTWALPDTGNASRRGPQRIVGHSGESTGLTANGDRISDMGKSWAARQAAFQGE
jgi:hypothetical protein